MRLIYLTVGFLSLALGVVGIVLPLLPTTPFLLLSAFCFARSSEKFHDWLLNHPYFGKSIKHWQEKGAISRKAKVSAMCVIALTLLISVLIGVPLFVLAIQLVVLGLVSLFILTRPE